MIDPLPIEAREATLLAGYAMRSADSAGRKHTEPPHPYRGPYQRDRDRIVHSAAFRRLSSKTQVFTGENGDYHRTRLTHTLEVASIARTLARAMRLNEDLVESLALAHDLGHPPFGHAGEEVLHACLADVGGFSHNRQGLRIVEELEQRYPTFPGLNLSLEVLEGQATRVTHDATAARPLLEVQVVDAADSIAYDTHDADDAMQLGLLNLDELLEIPLWREAADRVRPRYAGLSEGQLKRAVLHELIDWQVSDLLLQAAQRIDQWRIDSVAAVRRAPMIIGPNAALAAQKAELERFLHERVYRHPQVLRLRRQVQNELSEMFAGYRAHPELMPTGFRSRIEHSGLSLTVGDYLAGMTDRYARQEYLRLFAKR
ncbi:MAG TPA: deoxyguanosinetriphosphate triphosphohydrolase [Pirellulales bacterium]|jgi:dGTPase|nr:deoxyguanosinetriphosphate triphosphohydrolase [Pirellulales bacterium]